MSYWKIDALVKVRNNLACCDNNFVDLFFADIDECFQAAIIAFSICENDINTQCMNTKGSFNCTCVPGYYRVNGICRRKIKLKVVCSLHWVVCWFCSNFLPHG